MTTKPYTRKLTAILSADVKGYSMLMADDEIATVRTLTGYRMIMAKLIQIHRGRVVDSPGDNLLAEFGSVVDAVECAVQIQKALKAKNDELTENRKMIFRIGINLGDVIQEKTRIYGDGVNIAARVEGLADPGGISISGAAYDQVENKLSLGYDYSGEHKVKNIIKPIRVYKILMEPAGEALSNKNSGTGWKRLRIATLAVVLILVAGIAAIQLMKSYQHGSTPAEGISHDSRKRQGPVEQRKKALETNLQSSKEMEAPPAKQGEKKDALVGRIERILDRLSGFERKSRQPLAEKEGLDKGMRPAEPGRVTDMTSRQAQINEITPTRKAPGKKLREGSYAKHPLDRGPRMSTDEMKKATQQIRDVAEGQAGLNGLGSMPTRVKLRKEPDLFGGYRVRTMLDQHNFYVRSLNEHGIFSNDFVDNGDGTVTDRTTGLIWQKGGSPSSFRYFEAEAYVDQLNETRFSGYKDWRIPTLEELCSLLQTDLDVDEVFPGAEGWRRPPQGLSEGGSDKEDPDSLVTKKCWSSDRDDDPSKLPEGYLRNHVVDLFTAEISIDYLDLAYTGNKFVKAVRTAVK